MARGHVGSDNKPQSGHLNEWWLPDLEFGRRGIFRNERNAVKIQEPFPLSDCLGSENYAHSHCAVLQALLNFLFLLDAQIMKTPKGVFFHLCLSRCLKTAEQLRVSEALVLLQSKYFCSLNK